MKWLPIKSVVQYNVFECRGIGMEKGKGALNLIKYFSCALLFRCNVGTYYYWS